MRKHTFCRSLWEDVFIDQAGDVYNCSRPGPAPLGNIRAQHLRAIWDNQTSRSLREDSLAGRLPCFEGCPLIKGRRRPGRGYSARADYDRLGRLKVLFSEACNIKCIMCSQDSRARQHLDCGWIIRNVDLAPFRHVELQGGEPLFIEGAKAFFHHAAAQGKKPSFLTNGILIDDQWAEEIARHSEFVFISLNAATSKTHEIINRGSCWKSVFRNIARIREARRRLGTGVKIWGHMTIVPGNLGEVPRFIRDARRNGFDVIDFTFDEGVRPYLAQDPLQAARIRSAVARALATAPERSRIGTHGLRVLGLA